MPGEAYRDALATANARIQQLESEARERNIPLVFNRHPFSLFRLLALAVAASMLTISVLGIRFVRPDDTIHLPKPLGDSALQPTTLAWFEPGISSTTTRWGPQRVITKDNRDLLVGFVWRRGHPSNGLHVAAWERKTLKLAWVSEMIPATWVSADSDWRFHLGPDPFNGEQLVVHDESGTQAMLRLTDGTVLAKSTFAAGRVAFDQVPIVDSSSQKSGEQIIRCDRSTNWFVLTADNWQVPVPNTARASRLRYVKVDGELVFVLVDDVLHVFDAQTGAHRGVLEAP